MEPPLPANSKPTEFGTTAGGIEWADRCEGDFQHECSFRFFRSSDDRNAYIRESVREHKRAEAAAEQALLKRKREIAALEARMDERKERIDTKVDDVCDEAARIMQMMEEADPRSRA
jgi:hypothetical protein